MEKYTAVFVVTKQYEVEVTFEAPNEDIASEMANDMSVEPAEFIEDMAEDCFSTEVSDPESVVKTEYEDARVSRYVQSWCSEWLKDREEEEV